MTAVSGQNGNPYKFGLHCSQISSDGALTGVETIVNNYTSSYSTSIKISCIQNSSYPSLIVGATVSPSDRRFTGIKFYCLDIFSIAEVGNKLEYLNTTSALGTMGSDFRTTTKLCPDHYAVVGMNYRTEGYGTTADTTAIQWICEEIKATKCDTTSPTYCQRTE